MLKIELQISPNITQLEQFANYINLIPKNDRINFPPIFGGGFCQLYQLPYQIQVHHYKYNLQQQIEVSGINSSDNGLYMVSINLSHRVLKKNISETPEVLGKGGKAGVIFYSPGNNSSGYNEIEEDYEILFFGFSKEVLTKFLTKPQLKVIDSQERFCFYTELDETLSENLKITLAESAKHHSLITEGNLLQVLGQILEIFTSEKFAVQSSSLKLRDVEIQLKVKEILCNHLYGKFPTIDTISKELGVSKSKLKADFKTLFHKSMYQYYLERKMEIAKILMSQNTRNISEIGYQLGYSNISQFSNQFKKHFGILPSQVNV